GALRRAARGRGAGRAREGLLSLPHARRRLLLGRGPGARHVRRRARLPGGHVRGRLGQPHAGRGARVSVGRGRAGFRGSADRGLLSAGSLLLSLLNVSGRCYAGRAMSVAAPPETRYTSERYLALIDAGALGPDDKVELLEGEIVAMAPEGPRHEVAIDKTADALRVAAASASSWSHYRGRASRWTISSPRSERDAGRP